MLRGGGPPGGGGGESYRRQLQRQGESPCILPVFIEHLLCAAPTSPVSILGSSPLSLGGCGLVSMRRHLLCIIGRVWGIC